MPEQTDNLAEIRAAIRAITADHSDADAVIAAEDAGWNERLWDVLAEGGFTTIGVDEGIGGSGGTVAEACAVLAELGRAAASVPLAEHALLAGWLLSLGGQQLQHGIYTVAPDPGSLRLTRGSGGAVVSGMARHVPWASASDHVLAVLDDCGRPVVVVLPTAALELDRATNLAQEPREVITATDVPVGQDGLFEVPADTAEQLRLRGALSRAALISGALERASELTVRYTGEREQFGRPIGRFQAVQRHVVKLAEVAQQAAMATTVASLTAGEKLDFFEAASAKIVANECASDGTASAHQAHGAIGMTKEYELGQLSRRLWSWRDEYGHEQDWAQELGQRLAADGADALWPRIASGLSDGAQA